MERTLRIAFGSSGWAGAVVERNMAEIQCSYELPDGRRYEFIRADETAFKFEDDGVIHANALQGGVWRPDFEASAGGVAGKLVIWHVERFEDDGTVTLVSKKPMKLSSYISGRLFTLRPGSPCGRHLPTKDQRRP
jgi:hypothetical protein